MDELERLQGNSTKAVGLEHLPQEERLGELWRHLVAILHTVILLPNMFFTKLADNFGFIFSLDLNSLLQFGLTIQ